MESGAYDIHLGHRKARQDIRPGPDGVSELPLDHGVSSLARALACPPITANACYAVVPMILQRLSHHEVLMTDAGRRRTAIPRRTPVYRACTRRLRRLDLTRKASTTPSEALTPMAPRRTA